MPSAPPPVLLGMARSSRRPKRPGRNGAVIHATPSWEETDVVTLYEKTNGMSRRELLKRGGVGALLVISGSAVICPEAAWAVEAKALKPRQFTAVVL